MKQANQWKNWCDGIGLCAGEALSSQSSVFTPASKLSGTSSSWGPADAEWTNDPTVDEIVCQANTPGQPLTIIPDANYIVGFCFCQRTTCKHSKLLRQSQGVEHSRWCRNSGSVRQSRINSTWRKMSKNERGELLNVKLFDTLLEARVLIERWRVHSNTVSLHSSPGYRLPAPDCWCIANSMRRSG